MPPKVSSSPARRPRVFIWSSPPRPARGRRTEPVSAQAPGERRRAPDQVIAALPRLPQVRAARQSTAHRRQLRCGSPAGREADHLVPRGPSRPRKEGTSALRSPARPLGWGGGGLWRRRLEVAAARCWSCPPWSGAGGAGGAPRPPQALAGGGPERNPGLGAGRRLWGQGRGQGGGRCGLPPTRPTCCGPGWPFRASC